MIMPANALGPNTEVARQSATISLKNYALSPELKERTDARIKIEDPTNLSNDTYKRLEEWNKLKELLPESCMFDMVGGRSMYESAPAQSEIAIRRKAILAAGPNGRAWARDRLALTKLNSFRVAQNITSAPFPVPPAIATNCAINLQQTSASSMDGMGGTSIGPGFMAALSHLRTHVSLPIDLHCPIASSIPKHQSKGKDKAEATPLWIFSRFEVAANIDTPSPARFYNRQNWIQVAESFRMVDSYRAIKCTKPYQIPGAKVIVELPVTKSGEQHVIMAISNEGLTGPITWLEEHFNDIARMSSAPSFNSASLGKATSFVPGKLSEAKFAEAMLECYIMAGMTKEEMKTLNITGHSAHSAADVFATAFMWHQTARNDLGRWAHAGGEKLMHHRYSTKASAINQMRLRALIIQAITSIQPCPLNGYAKGFDIEHLISNDSFSTSIYKGEHFVGEEGMDLYKA